MDNENEKRNPFRPGAGLPPPLLAGRNREWSELEDHVSHIRADEPGGLVVMYGPRGNGKTSLLSKLEAQAKAESIQVRKLVADSLGGKDAPWKLTERRGGPKETTTRGDVGVKNVLSGSRETKTVLYPESLEDLHAMAGAHPLLLLVDEAHELPETFGKALLHHAQECVASQLPLLAVFAGTPGVPAKFQAMHASFWKRATELKIGRLGSDDDARKALSVPARDSGCPIDDDALELLVRHSQRYPYFVQMHGAETWKAARERSGAPDRITIEDARAGMERASVRRDVFYERRRDELFRHGVLDEAEALSEELVAMKDGARLSRRRLGELFDGMISKGLASDPVSVLERLVSLGLIWDSGVAEWEPGIPSLCAYLVKHRGVRQTGGSPGSG